MSSQVYKSKTEAAKKEYLKALAAYRASLVSKVRNQFLVFNVVHNEVRLEGSNIRNFKV